MWKSFPDRGKSRCKSPEVKQSMLSGAGSSERSAYRAWPTAFVE